MNDVSRSSSQIRSTLVLTVAGLLLISCSALLLSSSPDERRLAVYSRAANYSLRVLERNKLDYVGLLEILEPLGSVNAKVAGGIWRLRYNNVDCEFAEGKRNARIHGGSFDLAANFLLENGRGRVPLSDLGPLLSRILGGPVTLNQSARRLYVGNVAIHFTAQVNGATPPSLVMNFTSPVNPTIATEPGKLRMLFNHDPVVAPGSPTLTFNSKITPSATFSENNGAAEIVVSSTSPVMANFSNDGRTITIAPPLEARAPAPNPPVALGGSPTGPINPLNPSSPGVQHYFAVIDAAHGGSERGAALTDQLAEKDVTLALARVLRSQLEARGLPTLLLRDGDATLTLDQRASMTNSAGPAIYLCLHATSQGNGVNLYTAMLPASIENHGPFLDWSAAQTPYQAGSQMAVASLAAELRSKQIGVRGFIAPLRPLNNIATVATAIEVGPRAADISQLNSAEYQQLVMGAVAAGVADVHDKLVAKQ